MPQNELEDKVFGCLAGAQVGSALADPVEGWTIEEIEAEYGWLDHMVGREEGGEYHPPGTTEDGIERQKLQILSIIENGGPITARDLARTWLKHLDGNEFGKEKGKLAGIQDQIHYRLIEAGLPPADSGYHDSHPGRVGPHRCSHPNGIVNVCHPELAARNGIEVARIYQPPKGRGIAWEDDTDLNPYGGRINPTYTIGLDWSGAICAGIAEAMRPSSTVDSVVEAATEHVVPPVRTVIERGVEIGRISESYEELREEFYALYSGRAPYMGMDLSRANEIVPKGFGVFAFFGGDVRETIEGSANFGRDTDCLAAIAAGLAGAYGGSDTIPQEWVDQVDEAAEATDATVTDMPIEEQARGLYDALVAHHESLEAGSREIASMT